MTGSIEYKPWTLYFISQLKFPEDEVFQAPELLDVIFKMTRSLKYKPGFYILVSAWVLGEEVFWAPGLLDIVLKMTGSLSYTPGFYIWVFS